MVYCERCGSLNNDDSFFCTNCGLNLPSGNEEPIDVNVGKKSLSGFDEIGHHTASHSPPSRLTINEHFSHLSQAHREVLSLIGGFIIVLVAIALAVPNSANIVFPLGFTLFALAFTFYVSRTSSHHPLLFVAIALAILTIGAGLAVPDSIDIIFPVGFTLAVLVFVFYHYLSSSDKVHFSAPESVYYVVIVIVVLTLGVALVSPESTDIAFPIGFTVAALIFTYYRSLISSRDPVFFVTVGMAVITFGLALTIPDSSSIVLGVGFTLTTLAYTYYLSRISSRDPVFFVSVALVILTMGLVLTIPGSSSIILPIGFTLSILVFLYYHYRISSHGSIRYIIAAIIVLTFCVSLTIHEVSIPFTVGFGLVGIVLIINGLKPTRILASSEDSRSY